MITIQYRVITENGLDIAKICNNSQLKYTSKLKLSSLDVEALVRKGFFMQEVDISKPKIVGRSQIAFK